MTIETIKLDALQASTKNPRKGFKGKTIAGLAQSIKTDGLLQNLVVQPMKGKKGRYRIIAGERRYRALMLLAERGEIANDLPVSVEIRTDLSKDDTLRIATVENLQRENLPPLEEAAAFAKLIHKGTTLDDIVAQTGLSASTIKRRCVLNSLCKEAKKALSEGEITLSQAEAMTLGDKDAQLNILDTIEQDRFAPDADDIKDIMVGGQPTVAMAVFPLLQYKGRYTTDLFEGAETTYFDDVEQFFELQRKGVQELYDYFIYNAAWVDLTEHNAIRDWQYEEAQEGQHEGVLINLSPSGNVEIMEGLFKPPIDPETAEQTAEATPTKPKTSYGKPLCEYIAYHKTMAVQARLMDNPRKAKEVIVARRLWSVTPHKAFAELEKSADPQRAYKAVGAQAKLFAELLGLPLESESIGYRALAYGFKDELTAYREVRKLPDEDLEFLLLFVSLLPFGQGECKELDTGESLFNSVAQDLKVSMREHWQPDFDFLSRRNKNQCIEIAGQSGFAQGHSLLHGYKKGELVTALLRFFAQAEKAQKPNVAQEKARSWLPEVMQFPAIDPDSKAEPKPEDEVLPKAA